VKVAIPEIVLRRAVVKARILAEEGGGELWAEFEALANHLPAGPMNEERPRGDGTSPEESMEPTHAGF
jgi:hypothetical protein